MKHESERSTEKLRSDRLKQLWSFSEFSTRELLVVTEIGGKCAWTSAEFATRCGKSHLNSILRDTCDNHTRPSPRGLLLTSHDHFPLRVTSLLRSIGGLPLHVAKHNPLATRGKGLRPRREALTLLLMLRNKILAYHPSGCIWTSQGDKVADLRRTKVLWARFQGDVGMGNQPIQEFG